MSEYSARLRVRLNKRINSPDSRVELILAGRPLHLISENGADALKDTDWVIFRADGFPDEKTAREFGEQLHNAVNLTGFFRGLGVDLGDDVASGSFNESAFKEAGFLKEEERIEQDIHGLLIFGDTKNARFLRFRAHLTVLDQPDALQNCFSVIDQRSGHFPSDALRTAKLLNSALSARNPLAQFILSVVTVEAIVVDERWSGPQKAALKKLASDVSADEILSEVERDEIISGIRRLHKVSVTQGVRRVLTELGLEESFGRWKLLYNHRSALLHGSRHYTQQEVNSLATDAYGFASLVCLHLLERSGFGLPKDIRSGLNL